MDKATRALIREMFYGYEFEQCGAVVYVTLRSRVTGLPYVISHRTHGAGLAWPYFYSRGRGCTSGKAKSFDEAVAMVIDAEVEDIDRRYALFEIALEFAMEHGDLGATCEVLASEIARMDGARIGMSKARIGQRG